MPDWQDDFVCDEACQTAAKQFQEAFKGWNPPMDRWKKQIMDTAISCGLNETDSTFKCKFPPEALQDVSKCSDFETELDKFQQCASEHDECKLDLPNRLATLKGQHKMMCEKCTTLQENCKADNTCNELLTNTTVLCNPMNLVKTKVPDVLTGNMCQSNCKSSITKLLQLPQGAVGCNCENDNPMLAGACEALTKSIINFSCEPCAGGAGFGKSILENININVPCNNQQRDMASYAPIIISICGPDQNEATRQAWVDDIYNKIEHCGITQDSVLKANPNWAVDLEALAADHMPVSHTGTNTGTNSNIVLNVSLMTILLLGMVF